MSATTWIEVQKKCFTNWVNARLRNAGHGSDVFVGDIQKDLCNGLVLHALLEALSGQQLPKISKTPKMRIQIIANVNTSLHFFQQQGGVRLVGISAEDVADGNIKVILGLVWMLVLRYDLHDVVEAGSEEPAKVALLRWCQTATTGHAGVDVRDFTRSWHDGLAFCALIHTHRPELVDFGSLGSGGEAAIALAFEVAEKQLGMPRLIDARDVLVADENSMIAVLSQFWHSFKKPRIVIG